MDQNDIFGGKGKNEGHRPAVEIYCKIKWIEKAKKAESLITLLAVT